MINAFVRLSEILQKKGKARFFLNFLKQVPAFQIKNLSLSLPLPFFHNLYLWAFSLSLSCVWLYLRKRTHSHTHTGTLHERTHARTRILKASKVVNEV